MALTDKLTAIANAIRAKTGKTESLTLEQMPTEIESITTGGGSSADCCYVTFRNEATGEEFVKPVATGDDCVDVVAKGLWAKPTKPSDAQYDYTYYGWGASDGGAADTNILKNITEDKTVYAIFIAASIVKSGDCGDSGDNVVWTLNSNGVLRIWGNGAMADYTSNTRPWVDDKANVTAVVIDDGVSRIGNNAFYQLAMAEVSIPDSVVSIGFGAFRECANLQSITIPNSVTVVGVNALRDCTSLTSATFGSITEISWGMLAACTNLKNVTIPNGVTTIGQQAFMGCTSLKSVTIAQSVISIIPAAFTNCTNMTSAIFENTEGWWVGPSGATSGDAVDVSNPATAATLLNSTYTNYYWHRS